MKQEYTGPERRRNRGADPMGGARLALLLALAGTFVVALLIINGAFPEPKCCRPQGSAHLIC